VQGLDCAGISGPSPYRIRGGTAVVGLGAFRAKRPAAQDGSPP
jgi:hypothetical protein